VEHLFRVGLPTNKRQLERLAIDKHSSLFGLNISVEEKSFIRMTLGEPLTQLG